MKKINSERSEPSIPQEIMFEIFSWLPIKSLMRFRCVSILCNSLVSESDFKDIHRCRSRTRKKFFLYESESVFYSAEQKEDGKDSTAFLQIERLVLTLGIDKLWRETKSSLRFMPKPGVYINGVLYKFLYHGEHRLV
ncbi:putative F-box protein At1g20657 [Solanum dulcamara]|uniref:putative F-box protein At1g20657 n=1 Tax=Solanum dulcamara TaxID=45834 RepID=UPI002485169A|nr:putative F-box protein At1g20657 [Solanum dulcamara]